jgi:hypothetical protein
MMFPLFLTIIYLYELQNLADLAINTQYMFENSMHSYTAKILVILLKHHQSLVSENYLLKCRILMFNLK